MGYIRQVSYALLLAPGILVADLLSVMYRLFYDHLL